MNIRKPQFVQEQVGDELYEFIPLGEHIVIAKGVCGSRPTFKYTRLEVAVILDLLAAGWTIEKVLYEYSESRISADAIEESIRLAREAFVQTTNELRAAA
jgi:uncharacterized protein (DUF433 family)